jgi:hypothetical protein
MLNGDKMKMSEIWISGRGSVDDLGSIDLTSLKKLSTLFEFRGLELKKRDEGTISAYFLIDEEKDKIAAMVRIRRAKTILTKFPAHADPSWIQQFNLFVDPEYRRMGLASFFYEYNTLHEGKTVVSDDAQTSATIEIWKNKLVNDSRLEVHAIDLSTGRSIRIKSSQEFNKLKTWIYENYKVYLIVQAV